MMRLIEYLSGRSQLNALRAEMEEDLYTTSDPMKELRQLTEKLIATPFSELLSADALPNKYQVKADKDIPIHVLWRGENTTVCRAAPEANTTMEAHTHDQVEHLIVVSGEMEVRHKSFRGTYKVGDQCRLGIGASHEVYFPCDTVIIVVFVPRNEAFDDERED